MAPRPSPADLAASFRKAAKRMFCLATLTIAASAQPTATDALGLAAEGAKAAEAKDFAAYLEKMEAAVALRPDFPQLLINLAAAQVANDRLDDAIATLERVAKMGIVGLVDKSEEFAALRGRKDFDAVVRRFVTNGHPQGRGEIAFTLRDVTGLIEGIAWREKTREFYFGDVNGRAVWRRNKDNTLRRLTPEGEELLGVFALAVDEQRGSLWAATSAVPAMAGYTAEQEGAAALAEIDLESGAVRRVIALPAGEKHLLGDLALAPDGTVFVTDTVAAALWRLAPDGGQLESVAAGGEFVSPQGIAVAADGAALVVSDKVNGLVRVELPGGAMRRLEPPPDSTLIGIDGIARVASGDIIAIQNATAPKRVLRIALDAAAEGAQRITVLESGHLTMGAPSLGCIAEGGEFHFIGNSGWPRFELSEGKPSAPRPVPIFRTKLAR